jgi:hypothetical protein
MLFLPYTTFINIDRKALVNSTFFLLSRYPWLTKHARDVANLSRDTLELLVPHIHFLVVDHAVCQQVSEPILELMVIEPNYGPRLEIVSVVEARAPKIDCCFHNVNPPEKNKALATRPELNTLVLSSNSTHWTTIKPPHMGLGWGAATPPKPLFLKNNNNNNKNNILICLLRVTHVAFLLGFTTLTWQLMWFL